MCPNTPFGRFFAAYVVEVLQRDPVDHLSIEGVYFRPPC